MAITGYPAILAAVTAGGVDRTQQSPLTTIALTFLAGAYIALGGLLAIRAGGMLSPSNGAWPAAWCLPQPSRWV